MGYRDNDPCLAKVDADEPIFVLRAQDELSVPTIAFWLAHAAGTLDMDKVEECIRLVRTFADWQVEHPGRVKLPD